MIGFTSRNPGSSMSITIWTGASSWTLTSLPLFIWMGEILYRTRLSEDMFKGLAPWLSRLPGGLLHTNVVGCTVFAAVSGSSAATLTTVGKMSIPECASAISDLIIALAGAATLGPMIPPSLTLIVFGVTVKEYHQPVHGRGSAGARAGFDVHALYRRVVDCASAGRSRARATDGFLAPRTPALLIPVIALIVMVIGSMYIGIATATEAAAFGVVGALVLALLQGSLNWQSFRKACSARRAPRR